MKSFNAWNSSAFIMMGLVSFYVGPVASVGGQAGNPYFLVLPDWTESIISVLMYDQSFWNLVYENDMNCVLAIWKWQIFFSYFLFTAGFPGNVSSGSVHVGPTSHQKDNHTAKGTP